MKIARRINVGIENGHSGFLVVFADDLRNLRSFADALIRWVEKKEQLI